MLTTVAKFKEFYGIVGSDDDSAITRLIESASSYLQNECGRIFAQGIRTEFFDGDGSNAFFLKNLPISFPDYGTGNDDKTFIKINGELVAESDFYFHSGTGEVGMEFKNFIRGKKNIEIAYLGGYSPIPYDLEQACIELAGTMYKRDKSSGISSESVGDVSVSYSDKTGTPLAVAMIDKYKLFEI